MNQFKLYTVAVKLIGLYLFIISIYDLFTSFFWLSAGNWSDDHSFTSIAYSVVLTIPIFFSVYVMRKADSLVRSLKLVDDEGKDINLGRWSLLSIAELALFLLSGYFILINIVPFFSAILDFFVDSVRMKYPYNATPDEMAYFDMYNFVSGAVSLLIGAVIITNVPWFAKKLVGNYSENEGGHELS